MLISNITNKEPSENVTKDDLLKKLEILLDYIHNEYQQTKTKDIYGLLVVVETTNMFITEDNVNGAFNVLKCLSTQYVKKCFKNNVGKQLYVCNALLYITKIILAEEFL